MAEKLNIQYENQESGELHKDAHEIDRLSHEQAREGLEKSQEHKLKQNIENIREQAEKAAIESDKTRLETEPEPDSAHTATKNAFVNKELKDMAYSRIMNRTRQQLSPVGRSFSKLIHQPVVNSISEGAAKTVGRPSGLFGGGLVALIGTSIYYYITKHYGYDYNSFVFLALLAAGFVLGWIIEVFWRLTRRQHQ